MIIADQEIWDRVIKMLGFRGKLSVNQAKTVKHLFVKAGGGTGDRGADELSESIRLSPADQGAIAGAMEGAATLEEAQQILRDYP